MAKHPEDLVAGDLNTDEKRQVILLFKILTWSFTLFMFGAIVLQIYAGIKGWTWFFAIPLWALLWLGLQIGKRFFRNLSDTVEEELDENNAEPFE